MHQFIHNPHVWQAALPASVGCFLFLTACRPEQAPQAPPPPEVVAVTLAREEVVLTTELPGRTSPYRIAEIRPQVSGLIQERLFTEGSDVQEGDALYQIDPAPFQADLDNARAALNRAEASLPALRSRAMRFQEALADHAVSQQDFDDADAALKQAEAGIQSWRASVETAQIRLNYARMTSPISGRIGRSSVTVGAVVLAYQPAALATIQQLDPIYLDVPQSTTERLSLERRLKEGRISSDEANLKQVDLLLEDGSRYPLPGTLQFRDVSVDPTTASVILRIVFPNPDGILLPGMFVRAVVKEGVNAQAILVPQPAVSRDPKGNPYTLVLGEGNKVEQRPLTLDRAIGDKWLVTSGLEPGDRVITEGLQKIRPGMVVRVAAPAADRPQPSPGNPSTAAASN
ncbi:MAG: efflux RND transporter periplasmic adaptor subunit [Verrucomicrobiales bacterium]|nr:efflux RND transporter periplasmic adaptor subunit [Verrucomicrobiales bacterium]